MLDINVAPPSLSPACLQTGLANVSHVSNRDFTPVIKRALELPGWHERNMPRSLGPATTGGGRGAAPGDGAASKTKTSLTVGFGHHAVLGVAGKVIDAINTGKLKHIFLVGGCGE
jgi:hydroxylamine reductase